jgi:hypothetical protein
MLGSVLASHAKVIWAEWTSGEGRTRQMEAVRKIIIGSLKRGVKKTEETNFAILLTSPSFH